MNATQTQQWNDFACMSEALLAGAALKKIALTADDYRAKYEQLFPAPQKQYGGLILSRFYWIARDIGFGNDMDLIWRYQRAKEMASGGSLVFVFSALHLHPTRTDDFCHTSVLEKIDDLNFRVSGLPLDLPADDWVKKRCCGIVFF